MSDHTLADRLRLFASDLGARRPPIGRPSDRLIMFDAANRIEELEAELKNARGFICTCAHDSMQHYRLRKPTGTIVYWCAHCDCDELEARDA